MRTELHFFFFAQLSTFPPTTEMLVLMKFAESANLCILSVDRDSCQPVPSLREIRCKTDLFAFRQICFVGINILKGK